tara:strand:- start:6545 stop:8932 length:2388 start_codon:yes stop_codon:yes gene_type:complete
MSDLANKVEVIINSNTVEIIDNNAATPAVTVIDNTSNVFVGSSVDNTAVIQQKVTDVVEVTHFGRQGSIGPRGESGSIGPQGPRGFTGATGASFTFTDTITPTNLSQIPITEITTGSLYILTAAGDASNGISGSKGDGIVFTGTIGTNFTNTGPIQGPQGPAGDDGVHVDGVQLNNNLLTFSLSNGIDLPTVGPILTLQGESGSAGIDGIDGEQGIQGIPGESGSQGIQGEAGPSGSQVTNAAFQGGNLVFTLTDGTTAQITAATESLRGPQGIQGETGPTGSTGASGSTGAFVSESSFNGNDINFTLSDNVIVALSDAVTTLTGPSGSKGDKGDQGDEGPEGPQGTGVNVVDTLTLLEIVNVNGPEAGDMYIASNTDTQGSLASDAGDGIVYNETSGWLNVGPVRGPSGSQGPSGSNGIDGNHGVDGEGITDISYNNTSGRLTIQVGGAGGTSYNTDPITGSDGADGASIVGPPGATPEITIGDVSTAPYNTTPTVENVGTDPAVAVLNFTLPQGAPGTNGTEGGGESVFTASFTANQSVGGLSSGQTIATNESVASVLKRILYVPPAPAVGTISGLNVKNNGSSVGTSRNYPSTMTMDEVTWSRSTGAGGSLPFVTSISVSNETPNTSVSVPNDNSSPYTFTQKTFKLATSGFTGTGSSKHRGYVTIHFTKTNGTTSSTSKAFYWKLPAFFAVTTTNYTSANTALHVNAGNYGYDKSNVFNASNYSNGGHPSYYSYISWPSVYGNLSSVKFGTNTSNQYLSSGVLSGTATWNGVAYKSYKLGLAALVDYITVS